MTAGSGWKEEVMEKLLRCIDLGPDCDFEACGESEQEVLRIAVDHARSVHGLNNLSEKDLKRAREAIQDSFCVPKGGYARGMKTPS